MPRRLLLLRHGRTAWNASGRVQGHADVGLDEVGRGQARAVAAALAALGPARVWSSDLARARETAAVVADRLGLAVELDKRLREYDVGARQGLTVPEFAAQFPDEYAAWAERDDRVLVEGAESTADVLARIVPALEECLAALGPADTGVVVGHGASLKAGLLGLLGWPTGHERALRGLDNAAWAVVEQTGGGSPVRLAAYNMTADFASRPTPR
jgi:probable phosphoglycerate mutase